MRTPCLRCLLPLMAVAALTSAVGPARAQETYPKETWLGIYFGGRKIGYSSIRVERTSFRGQDALVISSTSTARIEMMGAKVTQESTSTTYADLSYNPVYQEYRVSSNGSTLSLKADYRPGKIACVVDSGGGPSQRDVAVPAGARLAIDSSNVTQGSDLKVGHKETLYYLNPLTITLDRTDIEVVGRSQVTLSGTPYDAVKVKATTPFGVLVSWESSDGEMLKGDMPLGMAVYREPREAAQNLQGAAPAFSVASSGTDAGAGATYTPPADLALATAVTTDRPIKAPRLSSRLEMTLSGIDDKRLVITDGRQRVVPVPGQPGTYKMRVAVTPFEASRSVRLPVKTKALQPYQARAPYLETNDPSIRKTAAALRGSDTNAYRVATRIRAWVHRHMTPDYTIGVPRSCSDIFRRRKGVCRDYATLFAGIARAAGIPTRVVGGMVYARDRFYYHAWAECWVGQWVPFDPTLATDYVDATHIKFAQGDVTDMYNLAGVVGRVKVHILSVD